MDVVYAIFFLILGLLLGSFYNVVGLRVPIKQSIVYPNSHCPHCHNELGPLELVPVLSYLFLGGKCKSCNAPISILYPFIELLTGLLFMYAYLYFGFSNELVVSFLLISLLSIIIVTDLTYMLIPNKILFYFLIFFLIYRIFSPLDPWWNPYAAGAGAALFLLFIAIISKGGMGGGDIKLFFVIGIALGFPNVLLTFFMASIIGALVGIMGILLGRIKKRQAIPFGPFIALGALLSLFYGEQIMQWYFHILW
ncbi:type 4 prepilin peptidase 1 [Bacillus oleivorans]|uniref:Type 4 prepilin peptidase 1 n=1 Tax=Bacillus oleivorans TaxID=1448271 RepID=A0A285CWV3_9BACI|nr:A24 family peptidase [Bacillus oleivorans]SNX71548.1 type 4 prepilin peptidase 1 [Bacillus oleivorans]